MIKETRNRSRMVYLRVLSKSYGTPQSILYEKGGCSIDFEYKIGKEFEGRCNMLISYAFKGRTKGFNPPGTKGFGTHTKHQGGVEKDPPSISRTRNATNLKPLEGLGVSFKVSKNFKLV